MSNQVEVYKGEHWKDARIWNMDKQLISHLTQSSSIEYCYLL